MSLLNEVIADRRGKVALCLVHWTADLTAVGSILITAGVVIALGKQFIYISSVQPSVKQIPNLGQLKCIDF